MYSTPTLATRFARNTRVMRGDQPLSEDQMRAAAPSIFAEILGLMMLAAEHGSEVEVTADGEDAEAALAELGRLIQSGFNLS